MWYFEIWDLFSKENNGVFILLAKFLTTSSVKSLFKQIKPVPKKLEIIFVLFSIESVMISFSLSIITA